MIFILLGTAKSTPHSYLSLGFHHHTCLTPPYISLHILQIDRMQGLRKCYRVIAVPLFEDNYSYVVQGTAPKKLVLIDPANPVVVLSFLRSSFPQHSISHVLYTHKHWDHAGGSADLYKQLKQSGSPDVQVVIGEHDRNFVEGATYSLGVDQELQVGQSRVRTLHVPCHTRGHTIYTFLPQQTEEEHEGSKIDEATVQGKPIKVFHSESCTFTGDTLFICGIGKFFEGNAAQMVQNIKRMCQTIDEKSHIYCGHEYALPNARWAVQVQKGNPAMLDLLAKLQARPSQNLCTLPSTLLQERQTNIFVRAVTGSPLLDLFGNDSVQLLRVLREMKNQNKVELPPKQTSSL